MNSPGFGASRHIYRQGNKNRINRWLFLFLLVSVVCLFLPWTQNIRTRGSVTALKQEQRPQEINTMIGGRIQKWYIKEGDVVQQGDTLVQLSEINTEYLDPQLLDRTAE